MEASERKRNEIIKKLISIGCVRTQTTTLKSGLTSPIYIDVRKILRHPDLYDDIVDLYRDISKDLQFDLICGVPYGALQLAGIYSRNYKFPLIIKRENEKKHGDAGWIVGDFRKGEKALLVEDVVTSGQSVLETVRSLRENGLVVEHAVTLVDREQGAVENLARVGISLRSALKVREIIHVYAQENEEEGRDLLRWLAENVVQVN